MVVSAASIWEIAIKEGSGKLRLRSPIEEMLEASGFTRLPMTADHAAAAGRLPLHHRDLFDRMLVAQAVHEGLTLVTRDKHIDLYDVAVLLA